MFYIGTHCIYSFDFTMCNPPFYSSFEEVARSASEKELAPNAVSNILFFDLILVNNWIHPGMYRS